MRELSQRSDALGVLSVYVNADQRHDPNLQATGIDLRNRYRELQRRVSQDADADKRRNVGAALERLWPQIETLAVAGKSGRGRIAFAALGSDWIMRLESQMPVGNRVVLDSGPFIHPLLELLDEGRRAGVVVVSGDAARLLEWRLGSLRELSRLAQEYIEAPHERAGQIGGGPAGQFNTPVREQRQARERDRSQRFLDQVTHVAAELSRERGWERILVSGEERWTQTIVPKFPQDLRDRVFVDPRILNGFDDAELAAAITEWVHAQHKERESHLLAQVRAAAGTGLGALGLSEVAAALNAGRVAHLVYDPEVRYVGTVGRDGALYGGDERGTSPEATPEPRLTERLVERALQTGARISPVEGAAGGTLGEAAGVGALLRW
ncbi:VLRF1 family aeRF1-type release factor [Mycolicibacterium sp. ND9-15]|uniref:MSMEG_1130 family ribosome hibernation factor n=1 Tax=Mycolicibacterium sp. ND9-15 TaxID=3042320 RepID=UPI002DDB74A1|nr:VLRF1 family aeRF1-type release factor [Mycolicibacterium sp. ND9-15]WSE54503.1 VLRF1 family aeRF1-type release factor [Mycolicibacterium sp. ND9-15]